MDRAFFIAEIETCSDMMYRVAWSILRNEADVQDALQDARILINVCYDTQRIHRKIVPLDKIPVQGSSAPDPDLAMALEALPEKLRLPLVLCYSEGMTYEEAADVLRIPMTTLRGRLRRGKKELRKELDAE